jgi:hypothetical protein
MDEPPFVVDELVFCFAVAKAEPAQIVSARASAVPSPSFFMVFTGSP